MPLRPSPPEIRPGEASQGYSHDDEIVQRGSTTDMAPTPAPVPTPTVGEEGYVDAPSTQLATEASEIQLEIEQYQTQYAQKDKDRKHRLASGETWEKLTLEMRLLENKALLAGRRLNALKVKIKQATKRESAEVAAAKVEEGRAYSRQQDMFKRQRSEQDKAVARDQGVLKQQREDEASDAADRETALANLNVLKRKFADHPDWNEGDVYEELLSGSTPTFIAGSFATVEDEDDSSATDIEGAAETVTREFQYKDTDITVYSTDFLMSAAKGELGPRVRAGVEAELAKPERVRDLSFLGMTRVDPSAEEPAQAAPAAAPAQPQTFEEWVSYLEALPERNGKPLTDDEKRQLRERLGA